LLNSIKEDIVKIVEEYDLTAPIITTTSIELVYFVPPVFVLVFYFRIKRSKQLKKRNLKNPV